MIKEKSGNQNRLKISKHLLQPTLSCLMKNANISPDIFKKKFQLVPQINLRSKFLLQNQKTMSMRQIQDQPAPNSINVVKSLKRQVTHQSKKFTMSPSASHKASVTSLKPIKFNTPKQNQIILPTTNPKYLQRDKINGQNHVMKLKTLRKSNLLL